MSATNEDEPYNSADEEHVKKAELKAKHDISGEVKDFKEIMGTALGRRFVWSLLGKCGIYHTSFTGNSKTFFNEGQRNVGLTYMNMVNRYCLKEYLLMVKENQPEG